MSERSKDEVKRIAAIGGKNSGKTRRKKKDIREICDVILSMPATDEMLATIKRSAEGAETAVGGKLSAYDTIVLAQVIRACRGDTAAAQYIRDSAGDKPTDKTEHSGSINNPLEGLSTEELRALLEK